MSVSIGGFQRRLPKTAQSRRALRKLEPKAVENPKRILYMRGANTSEVVNDAVTDLVAITRPYNKKLAKRNAFHPFEGNEHIQFLCYKNDCSLFCFSSDSKKRPHNLVIGRMFDFHVLDEVEMGLLAMDRLDVSSIRGLPVAALGGKPMFVFEGSEFDTDPFFVRFKNLLVDFFRGGNDEEIVLDGVDRVVMVSLRSLDGTAAVQPPSSDCIGTRPPTNPGNTVVCFRHYALKRTGDEGSVELYDIGPNFDLSVKRVFFAPQPDFKQACRVPREVAAKMKSMHDNVQSDALGNLRGQIHLGKQDVSELNLRKFKAHRTERRNAVAGESADGHEVLPERTRRKRRTAATEAENAAPDVDI